MTRINCIPASELTDKHLIAEYRDWTPTDEATTINRQRIADRLSNK